jgi:hypothetical protein
MNARFKKIISPKAIGEALAENLLIPSRFLRLRAQKRSIFLASQVKHGQIGAEIGVQKGLFTHGILHHCKPQKLHLIDPWYLLGDHWPWANANQSTTKALRNIIYWFRKQLSEGSVILHIGFDEEILNQFPDSYFDWVYLDTSHEYEHTKRELVILDKKVKAGGVIVGDDWFTEPDHVFYGQYLAITEFMKTHNYEFAALDEENHQFAIKKA